MGGTGGNAGPRETGSEELQGKAEPSLPAWKVRKHHRRSGKIPWEKHPELPAPPLPMDPLPGAAGKSRLEMVGRRLSGNGHREGIPALPPRIRAGMRPDRDERGVRDALPSHRSRISFLEKSGERRCRRNVPGMSSRSFQSFSSRERRLELIPDASEGKYSQKSASRSLGKGGRGKSRDLLCCSAWIPVFQGLSIHPSMDVWDSHPPGTANPWKRRNLFPAEAPESAPIPKVTFPHFPPPVPSGAAFPFQDIPGNHGTVWVGRDLRDPGIPWAGTFSHFPFPRFYPLGVKFLLGI